jgi:predicted HicB family RNase H-like nuclease
MNRMSATITANMPEWLKAAVRRKAHAEQLSIAALVRKALTLYVTDRDENYESRK